MMWPDRPERGDALGVRAMMRQVCFVARASGVALTLPRQMAAGGALIGLGDVFLIVGTVRRARYNRDTAALLRPHVARIVGGAVAGVQLRF